MDNRFSQIHLIPFDIGFVFIDVLAVDNSDNLLFAKRFIEKLSKEIGSVGEYVKVYDNLNIAYIGKTIAKYTFKSTEMTENAICYVRLLENLYCYILSSGVGMFVLADFKGDAINAARMDLGAFSPALIANYQKKITQSTILNKGKEDDVFPKEEELMLKFRKLCWSVAADASSKTKIHLLRKYSSNINYKAEGLSYVLTVYLFKHGDLLDKEMDYLMYSPVFSKVIDKNNWESINKAIINNESIFRHETVELGRNVVHFSWAGVGIISEDTINNYGDIVSSSLISTVVKAEIYVQSRWFVADNSMDNVNKSMNFTLENLQRIESLMEFSQAELDNEISANMNTLYKNVLEKIISTSAVRSLYKSVVTQIHTQKKIKEAHNKDKQERNRLISNLFLAVFTASALFDTIMDLINKTFNWGNIGIFSLAMAIAVGMVIFNYKNK